MNNTAQRNQNQNNLHRLPLDFDQKGCQPCTDDTKTLSIINEFKQLYEDKMKIINAEGGGDCNVQAKINLQQDWIRDLTEQNEMLVRAVEELEQEATERVMSLEEKLKQSSKCACEVMSGYKDISVNLEETFQQNGMLKNDIENLLEFIRRIRDENSWSVDGLVFNTISIDGMDVTAMEPNIVLVPTDNHDKTVNTLKEKDAKIEHLEKQLHQVRNDIFGENTMSQKNVKEATINSLRQSMLDMRDALTAEVADKHDTIVSLRHDVQLLEEQCRKGDQQTHFKDDIIKELRKEIRQLKNEKAQEKIRELEDENANLRRAIDKSSEDVLSMEAHFEQQRKEYQNFQCLILKSNETIFSLENEKSMLQQELDDLKEELRSQNEKLVAMYSREATLQDNVKVIDSLRCELEKLRAENQDTILSLTNKKKVQCCTCTTVTLQESIEMTENKHAKSTVKNISVGEYRSESRSPCRRDTCPAVNTERSRSISPQNINLSDNTNIVKYVSPHFSRDSSLESSVSSGMERSRSFLTSSPRNDMKTGSVDSRLKENEMQAAKKRIADLELQVQKINRKDELIDIQNDTLTIVENELQAWRAKEMEVEAARSGREREVMNLKEVIDSLAKSLDNEKKRSENLQKAVDLYLISISVLQESEDQAKREISDQRVTITNLQEALVAAKHSLEEHKRKASHECDSLLGFIEKLRDENLVLEVDLFYNHQDIEMYEMRVLKYQQMCREVQDQYTSTHQELKLYEKQKVQQAAFVDELSEQLSKCQSELTSLYEFLIQEQAMSENKTAGLASHIKELQGEVCAINQKLCIAMQCLEAEKKYSSTLVFRLHVRECEFGNLVAELASMKERLREATEEIALHKNRIVCLQTKLLDFEKSITYLDKESEICEKNINFCVTNLKDAKASFERKCRECENLKEAHEREIGNGERLQVELQKGRKCHATEMAKIKQTVFNMQREMQENDANHRAELKGYIESLNALRLELNASESRCRCLEGQLCDLRCKLTDANESEEKIQRDYTAREADLTNKLNHSEREQARLIATIANQQDQLNVLTHEIAGKKEQLSNLKKKLASFEDSNSEQVRQQNDEIMCLKNEINSMLRQQDLLKEENSNLQSQVAKFHMIVQKNEEKAKVMFQELNQCLAEIQTIQGDKEFLMQKNEQLVHEIQALQDACQIKAESVVTLEMELNDTKNLRDTLCIESRNVINNVKAWLHEQRQINVELNTKIHQKNCIINKLSHEKTLLENKLKGSSGGWEYRSRRGTYSGGTASPSRYTFERGASPPPGATWSAGSVESAGCTSDSEWDSNENQSSSAPQVWIHRVESLTGKLQKKNRYWKNRMDEHEYTVSKDK